jgi:hypothetical protein
MQLVDIDLSQPVIHYVVDCVSETVNCAFGRPASFRSRHSRKFTNFVSNVLSRAEVAPPTLLVALVYIARSRTHLSIALEQWALERVFLGALILASKYTQDSTLKNVHWGMVTGVFGKGDIGRIEREFLEVLDWQLGVAEADVLAHHEGLVAAAYGDYESAVLVASVKETKKEHIAIDVEIAHGSPASCPELDPSSPRSSAGSLSPRTPISRAVSPLEMDTAMDVSPTCTLVSPHIDAEAAPAPSLIPAQTTTPPPTKKRVCPSRQAPKQARRKLRDFLHTFQNHHHFAVEVAA